MKKFNRFSSALACILLLATMVGCSSSPTNSERYGYSDDSAITTNVQTRLSHMSAVQPNTVNVETSRGIVTLKGALSSQAEIDAIVSAAQGVDGVKSVTNDLTIAAVQTQ